MQLMRSTFVWFRADSLHVASSALAAATNDISSSFSQSPRSLQLAFNSFLSRASEAKWSVSLWAFVRNINRSCGISRTILINWYASFGQFSILFAASAAWTFTIPRFASIGWPSLPLSRPSIIWSFRFIRFGIIAMIPSSTCRCYLATVFSFRLSASFPIIWSSAISMEKQLIFSPHWFIELHEDVHGTAISIQSASFSGFWREHLCDQQHSQFRGSVYSTIRDHQVDRTAHLRLFGYNFVRVLL